MEEPREQIRRLRALLTNRLEKLEDERSTVDDSNIPLLLSTAEVEREVIMGSQREARIRQQACITRTLVVHSARRDKALYANPAEFRVELTSPVNNIVGAQLVDWSFPTTEPAIGAHNGKIRVGVGTSPVETVVVPGGTYTGQMLALELTTKMNIALHSTSIADGTYYIQQSTGYALVTADDSNIDDTVDVAFDDASHKFRFRLLDASLKPQSTDVLRLYFRAEGDAPNAGADDLADVLGFDRALLGEEGTADAASGTHYLQTTTSTSSFGGGADLDARYSYALTSSKAAALEAPTAVFVQVEGLHDNGLIEDGLPADLMQTFAVVPIMPQRAPFSSPAPCEGAGLEPYVSYRERRSLTEIAVRLRRPDGALFTFGGADYFFILRIVCMQPQAPAPEPTH